jgi:predicted chitinase
MSVTAAQIKAIAGSGARSDLVDAIVRGWPEAVRVAKLTTRVRAAAFLGQIMTETGGLKILSESGAYRWQTILKIFGEKSISVQYGGRGHSAQVTLAEAKRIAALPVAQRGPVLFNRVYGVGNPTKMREFNNSGPNDGWLYRGGGMMQCTGKSNYAKMAKKTGLPLVEHPELLHQPDSAFKVAYLDWAQDGRANRTADAIPANFNANIAANRRVINGGTNGLAAFKGYYKSAMKVLADYEAAPVASVFAEPEPEDAPEADDHVDAGQASEEPEDDRVKTAVMSVQKRLKKMNYSPGIIDGCWGSGISGALSGFLNDRPLTMKAPTSAEMFMEDLPEIEAELSAAESEGFVRPVSEKRASGDLKTVAAVAPEVVPTRRNFLAAIWASITAFFSAIVTSISNYISQAWDFFTDHKDSVPTDSGFLETAKGWLGSVPISLWIALAGCGLAFLAYNAFVGMKTIKTSVETGARQ